jgi:hypothetical protein
VLPLPRPYGAGSPSMLPSVSTTSLHAPIIHRKVAGLRSAQIKISLG